MPQPTLFFRNQFRERPGCLPFPRGVAFLSDGSFWYSGIRYGGTIQMVPLVHPELAAVRQWIETTAGDSAPVESDYRAGTAYRRIYWPLASAGSMHKAIDAEVVTQSFVALKLLLEKMLDIFETVEPTADNLLAYGHKIRELLLLGAMEVEASWAAVLKANGYSSPSRLTTNDYVKLLTPMLLDSYSLTLSSYPRSVPKFVPFESWSATSPTQSLDWYSAYNLTKHNREEHLKEATLGRAIHAVGAAVVMFYAQFGHGFQPGDEKVPFIRGVFHLGFDVEKYPLSCYIPNVTSGGVSWDWEMLQYPFN